MPLNLISFLGAEEALRKYINDNGGNTELITDSNITVRDIKLASETLVNHSCREARNKKGGSGGVWTSRIILYIARGDTVHLRD